MVRVMIMGDTYIARRSVAEAIAPAVAESVGGPVAVTNDISRVAAEQGIDPATKLPYGAVIFVHRER